MADVRSGGAFWELYLKDEKFRKGVKENEKTLKSLARVSFQVGGTLGTLGAAGAAAFAPAIKAASNLEEVVNKFNVTFGANAKAMREWGKTFADEIGRSERQILDFAASAQGFFIPLGIQEDEAEALSKQLTQLAIDLGSFHNAADADVMRDLKSALTGSHEVMAKYDSILTAARVDQELLNKSIDPKHATAAQKAMARLNIILSDTEAAQGDAMRSADSFANQMKRLQGEMENTGASIGKAVLPALADLTGMAASAAKQVADFAGEHPQAIQLAGGLTVAAAGAGGALVTLGLALNTASSAMAIYSSVSKAAQAGTITFEGALRRAGMAAKLLTGAAAVISFAPLTRQIYSVMPSIRALNEALAESAELSAELAGREATKQNDIISEASRRFDPNDRAEFLREQLAEAEKTSVGRATGVSEAKKNLAATEARYASAREGLAGYLPISSQKGQAEIDVAKKDLEEAKQARKEHEAYVHRLQEMLKDTEASAKAMQQALADPVVAEVAKEVSIGVPGPATRPAISVPSLPQPQGVGYSPEMARLLDESRFGGRLAVGGGSGGGHDPLMTQIENWLQQIAVNTELTRHDTRDMERHLRKSPVVLNDRRF